MFSYNFFPYSLIQVPRMSWMSDILYFQSRVLIPYSSTWTPNPATSTPLTVFQILYPVFCILYLVLQISFPGSCIQFIQCLAKTWIYLTPYVCTERIFDSRPFMYNKMFLKEVVGSSHLYASFGTFCVQIGQLFEAQWVI